MINIYYCLDKKYFTQLVVSLSSMIQHTKEELNVICLTLELGKYYPNKPKITKEQEIFCDNLLKSKNINSKFTTVDVSKEFEENLLPSVNRKNKFYHYYVCTRLLADKVKEIPDKVIYLDTDTFFTGDVKELWEIDNSGYELMGRKEPFRHEYINTGVMLLNMKLIRKNGTFARACKNCRTKKIFAYIDMTALNHETHSIKYIPKKFNNFVYDKNNIIHHLCVVREGKMFLSKKWRHRIKPDEIELSKKYLPWYKQTFEKVETYIKENPQIFPNEKLKVLEVLDTYYPKFDGPTMVVTNYAKCLNKIEGVCAEVCVPKFPNYQDNQPFNVFRVKSLKGPEGYYYAVPMLDKNLKHFLSKNHFDVIHIHSPFTLCNFFVRYGKKHHIPTIFSFHTKFKEDFDRILKCSLSKKIAMSYIMHNINRADYALSVSDDAGKCLKQYGYNKDVKIIRNGTDLVCPDNQEELRNEIDKLYDLRESVVFLSVGRIVENKRLDFALNVMKVLKDKNVKFKYLIIGAGSYEKALKESVKKLDLQNEVIFTGKIMDRTLLSAHYLRADLFIFPSTFDTASLAPIEASAMKLPTIMTKGCSTAEIITDGVNGILVESDVNAWADRIYEAISGGELKMLSENAYKQIYKTWDNVTDEVIDFYKKVIKNKNEKNL